MTYYIRRDDVRGQGYLCESNDCFAWADWSYISSSSGHRYRFFCAACTPAGLCCEVPGCERAVTRTGGHCRRHAKKLAAGHVSLRPQEATIPDAW